MSLRRRDIRARQLRRHLRCRTVRPGEKRMCRASLRGGRSQVSAPPRRARARRRVRRATPRGQQGRTRRRERRRGVSACERLLAVCGLHAAPSPSAPLSVKADTPAPLRRTAPRTSGNCRVCRALAPRRVAPMLIFTVPHENVSRGCEWSTTCLLLTH